MDEQGQTTGTEGTVTDVMATPAEVLAEKAPEILAPEPRKCGKCAAKDGNGAGSINEGEVIFNEKTRRYEGRLLCKTCGPKSRRPLLALEALDAMVQKLDTERKAQIAAAKAAHEADGKKFDAAKAVFRGIAVGKIRGRFVVRMDGEGNLLCGDERCIYCVGKDEAEMFAVFRTAEGWERVGLCIHQGAALREAKVPWVQIPWGGSETCDNEVKRRRDRDAAFVRAIGYFQDLWHGQASERPKPVLDKAGRLLCGVPDCGEKQLVEDGLASERHLDKAGLCRFHRAAIGVANRRGTNFFVAPLAECDEFLQMLRNRIRQAAWFNRDERPATRPEKPATMSASEKARAKNAAVAAAFQAGQGLEEATLAKETAAPPSEGDPVAAEVRRHNDAVDAHCAAKRKKGGGKNGDKGKPGKGGRK